MAKEEAKLVVKVDDKASKKIKQVDKSFLGLAKSLAPVAAGFFGVRAGMEAMKDAADFESVQRSFESLSASQGQSSSAMLANMKELSAGTVSDLELMKQANTALLLGLPVEKFGDMLKIARSSSKATGQSMEFMLNSIVTGLGRGCVAGDTIIEIQDGFETQKITIADAHKAGIANKKVKALGQFKRGCGFLNFDDIMYSGDKHCIMLSTESGKTITLTPDHKVFTDNEWIEAKDCLGESVALCHAKFGGELDFDKVISIKEIGTIPTFDVMNSETSSFVANGIVVHNSKLILDNLGIVFDANKANQEYAKTWGIVGRQLTEAEKKQAFINKALAIGSANAEKLGVAALDGADMMGILDAKSKNLSVTIGMALLPIFKTFFSSINKGMDTINEAFKTDAVMDWTEEVTTGLLLVKNGAKKTGQSLSIKLGSAWGRFLLEMRGQNKAANQAAKDTKKAHNEEMIKLDKETHEEMKVLFKSFRDAKKALQGTNNEEELEKAREQAAAKKELDEGLQAEADAAKLVEQQNFDQELKLQQFMTESELRVSQVKHLDALLKKEKNHHTKMALLRARDEVLNRQIAMKKEEFDKKKQKDKEENLRRSLSTIATLQNSGNKTLVALGKAAALAQIAINAPKAVTDAIASGIPFPGNFILAGVVAAAMAAQAAQVAGVNFAEGGIVSPTRGGTNAVIGEAGRSEAVIPLPDDFDPDEGNLGGGGTNITINVSGGLLGNDDEAREFARAIDQRLLELRQDNDSVSFDEGVI